MSSGYLYTLPGQITKGLLWAAPLSLGQKHVSVDIVFDVPGGVLSHCFSKRPLSCIALHRLGHHLF